MPTIGHSTTKSMPLFCFTNWKSMKKLLFLGLFFGLIGTANAQYHLGLKGGASLGMFSSTNPAMSAGFNVGPAVGLIQQYQFWKNYYIELDAYYMNTGGMFEYAGADDFNNPFNETITINQTTLHVPLMFMFEKQFEPGNFIYPYEEKHHYFSMHFLIGAYFNLHLNTSSNAERTTAYADVEGNDSLETVVYANGPYDATVAKGIDVGATAGIGFNWKVGEDHRSKIYLDFRYNYGFLAQNSADSYKVLGLTDPTYDYELLNSGFQQGELYKSSFITATLGYTFRVTRKIRR